MTVHPDPDILPIVAALDAKFTAIYSVYDGAVLHALEWTGFYSQSAMIGAWTAQR